MKNNGNKKRFRRLMSGLMAAVMCMSLIPGAAFAEGGATYEPPKFNESAFKKVDKNNAYYDSQGNYVVDGVKYYDATPNLSGYKEKYKLYRDMLSAPGPSGRSLAEEWFRLGVWISKQQSWTSAPYEPLQKAATGYGYELLTPDYKMNYYSGDHGFDVYTSGLKPANSMKDAETQMRQFAYETYRKQGGDSFTWEKSSLSNDDRKQDILYLIVRGTKYTGSASQQKGHGAGMGMIFSDFQLHPIFPDQTDSKSQYRQTADQPILSSEVHMTETRNDTASYGTASQALEHSASVEVSSGYEKGTQYSWEEGIEVGHEWGVEVGPVNASEHFNVHFSASQAITQAWSEGKATTNGASWSTEAGVTMPPYTRVLLESNTSTQTFYESWKTPMYLTYKVTFVDYSINIENGASDHDYAQVITSFPNDRIGEPGDAVSAVKYCFDNRNDFKDLNWNEIIRKSNSWEYHGVKGSIEPVINIVNTNIPDAPHVENLTSTEKVTSQRSSGMISLYPMKKIACTNGITEYTMSKGDYIYPENIELEGRLDSNYQNAPYHGFKKEEGYWALVDEFDNPIPENSDVARLEKDLQSGKQRLVAGTQPGKVILKYMIDEDYYAETSYVGDREGAHITNDSIETVRIPVTVKSEPKVGWKIELSGNQNIAAGDPAVAPALNVSVFNQYGREVNVPVHWYAKKLNDVVVQDDTFAAPADLKPGKYTVVAYLGSNPDAPDTYTEHTIEVKAPRTLGSLTTTKTVELSPKAQTLNLNALEVQMYDQYKGTDLDKAVNPKAAVASSDYETTANIVWTADNKNVTIKDGVAQFPAQNGTYTLTATCGKVKSDPVTVTVSGFVSFPDVKPGDWFYNGVMYSAGKGFMSGLPDGTFGPAVTMTRAQLVQMLYAFEGKPDVAITDKFKDVKPGDWFAKAVSWAVEKGITSGVGAGTFAPNNKITRQEMAVMMHAFKGRVPAEGQLNFADKADIASWAAPSVQWAVSNKLMGSTNPNQMQFSPKNTATRAEAAIILMNLDKMG